MNETARFPSIIAKLEAHYGEPAPPKTTDPLGLIIYENIGYLTTDEKRDAAFDSLQAKVGLKPTEILAASQEQLTDIVRLGGIHPELRAARLKEIAQITLNDFDGNLSSALKLTLPHARKALRKFPSIGPPGADKILLFTRTYPVLGLDSNGLRVLLRLGFGELKRNYSASYAAVQGALRDQIGSDYDFLIAAHQLLRLHGKELCRTNNPACEACPVSLSCPYYLSQEAVTRRPSCTRLKNSRAPR